MGLISWNAPGKRVFEAGVDRGVLYVNGKGVPWNGLISLDENPQGAIPVPHYIDGFKYLNDVTPEEYAATLNAFTYPDEFEVCDGTAYAGMGVYVDEQLRVPFDLCYRSHLGNDLQGVDYGYRLHLVYQALAAPSTKTRGTIGDSVNPTTMSWSITTLPQLMRGYLPTSHLILDSRKMSPGLLAHLEDKLYGSLTEDAKMIQPNELLDIFETWGGLEVTVHGNGTFTVTGTDDEVVLLGNGRYQLNGDNVQTDGSTFTVSS